MKERDLVNIKKIGANFSSTPTDFERQYNSPGKYIYVAALDVGGRYVYFSLNNSSKKFILQSHNSYYFSNGFNSITLHGQALTGKGGSADRDLNDIELWISDDPISINVPFELPPERTAVFTGGIMIPDGEILYILITLSGTLEYSTKSGFTNLTISVSAGQILPLNPWKLGSGTTAQGIIFYRR